MQSPEPNYVFKKGVGWVQEPAQITFDHTDLSVWTTGDGRVLRVVDMTNQHVLNAIRKLRRHEVFDISTHDLNMQTYECAGCIKKDKILRRIISLEDELNRRRREGILL